jgi:hypothetical protein
MMQRKLTQDERSRIDLARSALSALPKWSDISGGENFWVDALMKLSDMATSGTTDGKPWAEPQPEIGDGYRVATEEDKWRQDRQAWNFDARKWQPALHGSTSAAFYRVPIDRIPTDEDAVGRPTVMVCDNTGGGWLPRTLLHVSKNIAHPFLVISGDGFTTWKQARFPYPGELD